MAEIKEAKISDLVFDDRNFNKHTDYGMSLIEKSIRNNGAGRSILIDKNNRIIAGNGVTEIAGQIGLEDVQIVETDGTKIIAVKRTDIDLDSKQGREMALADNATAAVDLEWDADAIADVSAEFDIDVSGWGVDVDLEEEQTTTNKSTKSEDVERMLNETTKNIAKEIAKQYDTLQGFSFITPSTAKFNFINFKYYNKSYQRYNSIAFHKQQFITAGDSYGSTYDGLLKVAKGEIKPERLRFVSGDDMRSLICGSLPFGACKMPLDFPAELARDLCDEFMPLSGGKMLDPCAGWGGRLVGFLASNIENAEYTGIDASPLQIEGDMMIYNTFKDVCELDKVAGLYVSPFEDYECRQNYYDFALTSPPYFDTEKYLGGEQSHKNYSNYELWRDGFYSILIEKVYNALIDGGVFCLQVGSQRYPLLEDGKAIAEKVGFIVADVRATDMTNSFCGTETERGEIVIVLRKEGAKDG